MIDFNKEVPLITQGFSKQDKYVGFLYGFCFENYDHKEWYNSFVELFFSHLEQKKNLPVFRSGHGEFSFSLGKMELPSGFSKKVRFFVSRIYRFFYFQSTFYSGTPQYGYETYKLWELNKLRKRFASYLRFVSTHGVLCMYFSNKDAYPIKYQKLYLAWLSRNNITISTENYFHVYFIYALFNSELKYRIYQNRTILVITSFDNDKQSKVRETLTGFGAKDVMFIKISRNHALKESLSLPNINPDLCLIGAGVGASNILFQLKSLNCPCVDVGFVLDILADKTIAKNRVFCTSDEDWDTTFPNNNPDWAIKFKQIP